MPSGAAPKVTSCTAFPFASVSHSVSPFAEMPKDAVYSPASSGISLPQNTMRCSPASMTVSSGNLNLYGLSSLSESPHPEMSAAVPPPLYSSI